MKTNNKITNTTVKARSNPIDGFVLSLPGGIEASEARGQQELVHSAVLPADMRDSRTVLEAWGIVFGKTVGGDTLFIQCTLPAGWKKEATDHAMWSNLLDEQGRKRAAMFYKAAHYDRRAFINVETRFRTEAEYPAGDDYRTKRVCVKDSGKILFTSNWYTKTDEDIRADRDLAREAAEAWLAERFPQWQDPAKYWELP